MEVIKKINNSNETIIISKICKVNIFPLPPSQE